MGGMSRLFRLDCVSGVVRSMGGNVCTFFVPFLVSFASNGCFCSVDDDASLCKSSGG